MIEIGAYIAQDNPARARSFIGELHEFLNMLSSNPRIGRMRPELALGLRCISFVGYPYTIYYRVMARNAGVKVERVLHGARDVGAVF